MTVLIAKTAKLLWRKGFGKKDRGEIRVIIVWWGYVYIMYVYVYVYKYQEKGKRKG